MNLANDASCLERLQREKFAYKYCVQALTCLNGFPNKVRALNDIISTYAPEVTKKTLENTIRHSPGIPLSQEPAANELNSEKTDEASIASASKIERSQQKRSKKNLHHSRRLGKKIIRRRPGPLSQILTFISNSLAICTKATVIKPSKFIANHAFSMLRDTLIHREGLVNVRCGPSAIWSLPEGRASLELKIGSEVTVDNCIQIMRPAAAQLIADTTKLKRWLQALAVTFAPPTSLLIHAIRRTEAIDGWAYELFFHLKYLQENRLRHTAKKAAQGFKSNEDVRNTNLWHRLVQLRDNYLILYETLFSNNQYHKFSRELAGMIE